MNLTQQVKIVFYANMDFIFMKDFVFNVQSKVEQ